MGDRERVEALGWIRADLRTLYRMGSEQRQNLSDLTRRLDENARQIADLLEGNGLRDLLAEAKADGADALECAREQRDDLRELLDVERHEHAVALNRAWHEGYGAGSSDATDGWLNPGQHRLTPNPYRETSNGGSDD